MRTFCMMEALHYGRVCACIPRRDIPPSNSAGSFSSPSRLCAAPSLRVPLATVFAVQPASPHASDVAATTSAIDEVGAVAHRAADASDAPLAGRTAYRAVSYYSYRYL